MLKNKTPHSTTAGNQSAHTALRYVYLRKDGRRYTAMPGSMQSMVMRIFGTIGKPELKTDQHFENNEVRGAKLAFRS